MLAGLAEYDSEAEPERNGNGASSPGAAWLGRHASSLKTACAVQAHRPPRTQTATTPTSWAPRATGARRRPLCTTASAWSQRGERRADRLRLCSEDSAVRRLRNAERQLYDREEALSAVAELPDPLAVLGAATQWPRFLDPEATRPLAEPVHRGRPPPRPCDEPADRPEGGRKRAPGDWDIASMAPPLKGAAEAPRGVISAPAKRYRTDERVGSGAVTAAQVHRPRPRWLHACPWLAQLLLSCPERPLLDVLGARALGVRPRVRAGGHAGRAVGQGRERQRARRRSAARALRAQGRARQGVKAVTGHGRCGVCQQGWQRHAAAQTAGAAREGEEEAPGRAERHRLVEERDGDAAAAAV